MPMLEQIEWEACVLEPRPDPEAERYVKKNLGLVPPTVVYFTGCPWLLRASVNLMISEYRLVHLDFGLSDLIALAVSQDNSCRYCYAASRALLKILGFPEDQIRLLEEDLLTAQLSASDKLALDYVRKISRSNPRPSLEEKQALLNSGYKEEAVHELAYIAAINIFFNRVATLPAIPTATIEQLPEKWLVKLMRPLLARRIRSRRKRVEQQYLPPDQKTGPFSDWTNALDGLPAAKSLREVIDDAWCSDLLGERAKALVFLVVARALGCLASEAEATKLLVSGGLDESHVGEILNHLASPVLDPIESAIVPYARETAWYQPVQIQRRSRAICEMLSREQFLELIGVASLANTVCRLSVVLDLH